jgi:hypothetical protein
MRVCPGKSCLGGSAGVNRSHGCSNPFGSYRRGRVWTSGVIDLAYRIGYN